MKLKEFDSWYQGLQDYWINKIDNPPASSSPWRIPITPSISNDYPPASGAPIPGVEGGLWLNQLELKTDVLSTLSIFQDSYQIYYDALKTGAIYSSFYANLITLFSFVSMREGMRFKDSPSFTLDQVSFGTCQDWFSWYDFDLIEYSTTDSWFSVMPVSAASGASGTEYTYSGSGSLLKVTSLINPAVTAIQSKVAVDTARINSLQSILQANSTQKIIYQMYSDPPPIIMPPKKEPKKIILEDYKVKEIATEMGWNIPGIT